MFGRHQKIFSNVQKLSEIFSENLGKRIQKSHTFDLGKFGRYIYVVIFFIINLVNLDPVVKCWIWSLKDSAKQIWELFFRFSTNNKKIWAA